MQTVLVNGERTQVPVGCTVDRLLEQLAMAERRVAVAVNRSVVPRSTYPTVEVRTGDRIEILEAVGGG